MTEREKTKGERECIERLIRGMESSSQSQPSTRIESPEEREQRLLKEGIPKPVKATRNGGGGGEDC